MKIFKTSEIPEIDSYTIRNEPVLPVDLMERAAKGCVQWIESHIGRNTPLAVFTGPGNNGGDGWAIARLLNDRGYSDIRVFELHSSRSLSRETALNRNRVISGGQIPVHSIETQTDIPQTGKDTVIVDALFGTGLNRPLEGLPAAVVRALNDSGCRIISVDIPSGLMGEENTGNPEQAVIRASVTLTFQFPKRSFFYAENHQFCGSWHIIPIGLHPDAMARRHTSFFYTTAGDIAGKLIKRETFSHKGSYGHALLIAGSHGMMGAAIMAARSCLRTGAGLLTTHIPRTGYPVIQGSVPESIFSIDQADEQFSRCPDLDKYSSVAAGPGIGTKPETALALESLIKKVRKPMVLDADALNILSTHREMLQHLPENTIITPHPGEFDRLFGKAPNGYTRNETQIRYSSENKLVIILKGAYSSVTLPDGRCYFNSTGNPGMATAGSGDVLTGIILSLLAQGYSAGDAAITGTFVHGLAGDIAARTTGERGLIASDIIDHLGEAFKKIENYENSP